MPNCSVPGCDNSAAFEVVLYDIYSSPFDVFYEQDITCPYICSDHANENEKQSPGARKYRGVHTYPFTNKNAAQGFTIYRPLAEGE